MLILREKKMLHILSVHILSTDEFPSVGRNSNGFLQF